MSWLGYAITSYTASPNSLPLPQKDSEANLARLLDFCKTTTPPCQLNPLLFNGHLSTVWTIFKESLDLAVYYKRRIFISEDSRYRGTFAVDFTVDEFDGANATTTSLPPKTAYFSDDEWASITSADNSGPLVVTLHGLSGGSHEVYLRSVLKHLLDVGFKAVVINSRGCSRSSLSSGILFNARATWDTRQVVRWLKRVFPNRPLFGLGFSLGANIMVNYLGEEGADCLLDAAVVISNPWNLDISSMALQRSWIGREVYSKAMCRNLQKLFERHVNQISQQTNVNVQHVREARYLHEFDRELQCPTWLYPSEGAYYRDASSCDAVLAVRVPLLAIHAEDDPIAAKEAIPYQEIRQNPYVVLCTTTLGGHLGWFEWSGERWFAKAASRFLQRMYVDVDLARLSSCRSAASAGMGDPAGASSIFLPVRRRLKFVGQTWEI